LITPARFLFDAGATPKDFNRRMLDDPHLKVVDFDYDTQKYFRRGDIEGGVAITFHDNTQNFGAIGTFIPFDELESIHQKIVVDNPNFRPLGEIIYSKTTYNLTKKFHADNPNAVKKISKGHADDFATNIIDLFADLFFDEKPDDGRDYVQVHGRQKNGRVCKWFRSDWVTHPVPFDKFKVLVPLANGSGAIGKVECTPLIGNPFIGEPFSVNTATYITIGAFDNRDEAEACLKYIKSKFARAMLGILKVTPVNPAATWAKVPLQDFSATSDIDWRGDIDGQLYRKYNLSDAEINFIETHVKAMD
ncbi:MAG: Eco57I restriction-modification methylase domain-containing protein, partial [Selenomonadaceae bacterium]|nr:Eco57I restriction-modification methylase domain-containing protein [Selenomonadaceae bacterium]